MTYATVHDRDFYDNYIRFANLKDGENKITITSHRVSLRVARDRANRRYLLWRPELADKFGDGYVRYFIMVSQNEKKAMLELNRPLLAAIYNYHRVRREYGRPTYLYGWAYTIERQTETVDGKARYVFTVASSEPANVKEEEVKQNTAELAQIVNRMGELYHKNTMQYLGRD